MSIDPRVPITLLPVRIETRFAGTEAAPRLLVRLYPDDAHVDHHDPRLTAAEVAAGQRYWTSVRGGTATAQAWAQLLADAGPARAIWTRQALTPANVSGAPVFPTPAVVDGNAGSPAVARALPSAFVVRVRYAGGEKVVQGTPVPETLAIGVPLGSGTSAQSGPDASGDATRVLDERIRWMVDFPVAVAAGMAVEVDLPAGTQVVQSVVAIGLPRDGVDGAAVLADLVERHRLSDGAAFLAPGTPTNNLADSASGYGASAVSDPAQAAAPADGSASAALAAAWGISPGALAMLDGAADRHLDEARLMSRALFEATWGAYLREQGQPAFGLAHLPEVYAHVTSFVRGGGPLPAVRLGRQPYAIAPVLAPGKWAPLDEGAVVRWLSGFLPQVRGLWTSGLADVPAGPDLFAYEPVSTRVRLRTVHLQAAVAYMIALGAAQVTGDVAAAGRLLLADVGLTNANVAVATQLYARTSANLWLPMAADGDTAFDLLAPVPNNATSVLGLLLRGAALELAANATHEFAGLAVGHAAADVARAAPAAPIANLSAAAGHVKAASAFSAETKVPTPADKMAARGKDASGRTFTIRDRLGAIVTDAAHHAANITRYFNSDALAAFRDAVHLIAAIPTARRAVLTGEILDCASHRYDAWVTSLATARLAAMRRLKSGNQVGAWGAVLGIQRRAVAAVPASNTVPPETVTDPESGGYVLAPAPRHAITAGVLRSAWRAHGGSAGDALAPFATALTSATVRRALAIADGMRNGQALGALLGYLLERGIHDASGHGVEIDWVVFELRRLYPLAVSTSDNVPQASAQRVVADGWKLAEAEAAVAGVAVAAIIAPSGAGSPPFGAAEKVAVQGVIDEVVAVLDAVADLGLAESVYQLAGANLERAAAATDMLGRAAAPPDVFEVAATPRGGRGIEQRLIVTFAGDARPAGYATDTPRARLAPGADAFVARRLGSLDGIRVRFLDAKGRDVVAPLLSSLRLSALDIAALDLTSENVALSGTGPDDLPGTPNSNPGRQGVARLVLAAGNPRAATVGFAPDTDAALLDLLDHAAAWHQALAGRRPLTADTFVARAQLTSTADNPALVTAVAAFAQELGAAPAVALAAWGIGGDATTAPAAAAARVAAAAAATDAIAAAGALLGGTAVVEGALAALPPDAVRCAAVQPSVLGARAGVLERWLQDSARVRAAAASLGEALLRDELAGRAAVACWAGQSPAAPYTSTVPAELALGWVGAPFPGPLADGTVTSVVGLGDGVAGAVRGIELDAWTEVVPNASGTAAVTANLSAPEARAPNVILVAVPPDTSKPWTNAALLSVVDEALDLAQCRMVDLDATRRVAGMLPAAYVTEYDPNGLDLHRLVSAATSFPVRWVAQEGQS